MTIVRSTLAALALSATFLAPVAAQSTTAIVNGRLELVGDADSPRRVERGTLIIRGGRIVDVGTGIEVPEGANVIDARGAPVTPGIFAAFSGLGLEEISLNREANDRSTTDDVGLNAALNAADGIYADATGIPLSRAGGVTRALSAIDAGPSLVGGCAAIIDLSGDADPLTERCAAQVVALGYGGASRAGSSRPASIAQFRRALEDAKSYTEDPYLYRRNIAPGQLAAPDAEALARVLDGLPLIVSVNGRSDIARVLDLGEEYGLDLILLGAAEAYLVADDLAAADVPVIINPVANLPSRFETLASSLAAAASLADADVYVAFYDDFIGASHSLQVLTQLAGNAVANGMPYQDALGAIMTVPARIYGMDEQLGTLSAGKIADVVVWNGDPLEIGSAPVHVFVNGRDTSLETRADVLTRRYRDLSRGSLPPAYRGQ